MGLSTLRAITTAQRAPPTPSIFRELARRALSERFATPLAPARVLGTPRPFDIASEDGTLLGVVLPPAGRGARLTTLERAELSEAVLLLTLAPAQQRLLVVGHDRRRLAPWFAVYGHLARDVEFWSLRAGGSLERIA